MAADHRLQKGPGATGIPVNPHNAKKVTVGDTKMFRYDVPNSIDLKIWVQLDPHRNRLTSLRLARAREDYRRQLEAETTAIPFNNRGNANSMAIPSALLQMQLKKADEFAEQRYAIFRDVWLQLGGVESAAFIRTVSWKVIQPPFTVRGTSFAREEQMRCGRSGGLRLVMSREAVSNAFDELKGQWRDKLEIKALEWEAQAQRRGLATALQNRGERILDATNLQIKPASGFAANATVTPPLRDKRATRPKPPSFESAIEQLRKNAELTLVQFCRLMDRKAAQFPTSNRYLPPKSWRVRSFFDQYKKRSNTVSRFLSDVRKAINFEGG